MNQQNSQNDQLSIILKSILNPNQNIRIQAENQINHFLSNNFGQFLIELSKKVDSEIKEMEEEIKKYKMYNNNEKEKINKDFVEELNNKTKNLIQKHKEYEEQSKQNIALFKDIKKYTEILFNSLDCENEMSENEKIDVQGGVTENNIMKVYAQIEKKLKFNEKILEQGLTALRDENTTGNKNDMSPLGLSTKQVNDNMKIAFSNMDINKIKAMEKIKNSQNPEDLKLENLISYSKDIANEVMNSINKNNLPDKKGSSKMNRKGK